MFCHFLKTRSFRIVGVIVVDVMQKLYIENFSGGYTRSVLCGDSVGAEGPQMNIISHVQGFLGDGKNEDEEV